MMGPGFGDAMGRALVFYATMLTIGAALVGAFLMWAIPKLWHWIVPIIHRITA